MASNGNEPLESPSNEFVEPSMTMPVHMYPVSAGIVLHPHPRSKRRQVKNACTNCQKACKKCDDGRPCLRCIKYGISEECVDSARKERAKGTKRGPYKKCKGQVSDRAGNNVEQEVPQQQDLPVSNGAPPSTSGMDPVVYTPYPQFYMTVPAHAPPPPPSHGSREGDSYPQFYQPYPLYVMPSLHNPYYEVYGAPMYAKPPGDMGPAAGGSRSGEGHDGADKSG